MQCLNIHCNEFFSPCFPVERIDPQALRTGAPPARWINAGWAVSSLESGSLPSWRGRGRPPPRRCRRAEVRGAAARPAGSTGQNVWIRGVIEIFNFSEYSQFSEKVPTRTMFKHLFCIVSYKIRQCESESRCFQQGEDHNGVFSKYCEHFAKFRWEL